MIIDWKAVLIGTNILTILVNIVIFATIKFNDLRHLGKDVAEIKEDNKKIIKYYHKLDKKIARREALCGERHPKK